ISAQVQSPLLAQGRLQVNLVFPYPTAAWTDEGTNYQDDNKHQSSVVSKQIHRATLLHQLDTTHYFVQMQWSGQASLQQKAPHSFFLAPSKQQNSFSFSARFTPQKKNDPVPDFAATKNSSTTGWKAYWTSGGAIDFSGSTDQRAHELERRVVLSQYLMKAQEAGDYPPQETGLTYNSWFGKPHLEMTWWHAAHYGFWGRTQYLESLMDWYASVVGKARLIAQRQGYEGLRWQKMTDNNGDEAPSSIGAFLIWQQPHFIYFAEQCYRNTHDKSILEKYKDLVFGTADFMASFARFDSAKKVYVLGKGVIAAQERFKAEQTFNPTYELVYWQWALQTAQQWRQRLGMARNPSWETVVQKLSPLPVQENKYLFTESATDSYTNPEFRTDHPSVLAALGVMPQTGQVDLSIMKNTFNWIWNNWTWPDTWGWDFPMTAMTAT
ncbi:MAG TPA: hypothetical protein VFL47_08555, partial [Flavisolibacter sp.]|nr:hypothetical protein [Flavisolibacter sp.]